MAHRHRAIDLQVADAADIGGQDQRRLAGAQLRQFVGFEPGGQLRLQHRIGASRTTTHMPVGHGSQFQPKSRQQRLDPAREFLPVLQAARRLENQLAGCRGAELFTQQRRVRLKHLQRIAHQSRKTSGPGCVGAVVTQQKTIVLQTAATAAGRHHDGFNAGFDLRPAGIDQAPHLRPSILLIMQMMADRTATAGSGQRQRLDADCGKQLAGGDIDIRRQRRLHAPVQQQQFARMCRACKRFERRSIRNAALQRWRQKGFELAPKQQRRCKQPASRQ